MPRMRMRKRRLGLSGAFRGPHPFARGDERFFFGRAADIEALSGRLTNPRFRLALLEGPSGVGKTSLVLAGISKHFNKIEDAPLLLYVDAARGLKGELSHAIDELSSSAERAEDPLERLPSLASALNRRLIVAVDHLDMVLSGTEPSWEEDRRLLSRLCEGAVSKVLPGVLLVIERGRFAQLVGLLGASKIGIAPGMLVRLEPMHMDQVRTFIEQSALASGRYLEAGMAGLIAQDVAADRPTLPLDLQVLMAGVFETGRANARKYLAAGGAPHVMADWVEGECSRAGGRHALEVLSVLADEAEEGHAWVSAHRLSALTGMPEEQTAPIVAELEQSGLVATWETRIRLSSVALVRLVRRVDGALRARRRKAQRYLEKRNAGRIPLLPHELLVARPFANSERQRALVKRSGVIWGAVLAAMVLALAGLLTVIQLMALHRRTLDVSEKQRPDATVVVRKGGGTLTSLALFPTSPPFGTVLWDTAVPASALARPLSGPRLVGVEGDSSGPGWFKELLNLLSESRHLELQAGLQPERPAVWKNLAKESTPEALSRTVELIGILGKGDDVQLGILLSAMASGGPLARRATEALLAISMRNSKLQLHLEPQHLASARISADLLTRVGEGAPLCRVLRAAAIIAQPTRRLLSDVSRAKACPDVLLKLAAEAVGSKDAVLAARGYQILAKATKGDASAMALRLLESLSKAAAPGRVLRLAARLEPKLEGTKISAAALTEIQSLLKKAASPATAEAAAALLTRMGRPPTSALDHMAALRDKGQRIRAAAVCRGMLSAKPGPLPASVAKLLQDDDESVLSAALSCAAQSVNPPPAPLLRMVTGGSPVVRAAAMEAFAATKTTAPDPYKVARFFYVNGKSGEAGLAGAVARAASKLVRRPSHWDVAKFFILPATHAPHARDRALSASAVARLLDVNASAGLKYLERLASDAEPKVRLALVDAIERLPAAKRRSRAQDLVHLLAKVAATSPESAAASAIWALLDPHFGPAGPASLSSTLPRILARGGRAGAMMALLWPVGKGKPQASQLFLASLKRGLASTRDARDAATLLARLAEMGTPESGKLLVRAAGQPSTSVTAMNLACKSQDLAEVAARQALSSGLQPAQKAALECLMRMSKTWKDDNLRKLVEPMASGAGPLRALALAALANCGPCRGPLAGRLRHLAMSASTADRLAASEAAFHLGPSSKSILSRLVSDPSLEVRRAATLGLARLWSRTVSPEALAETARTNPAHRAKRHAAILALCLHADRNKARKALKDLTDSSNPLVSLLARDALASHCSLDGPGQPSLARLIDLLFLY